MLEELQAILATDFGSPTDAAALAKILYRRCYTHSIFEAEPPEGEGRDLTTALVAANRGRGGWDLGWRVEQALDDGRMLARKGFVARAFAPGQYIVLNGPGGKVEEGQALHVFGPGGSAEAQPGYYHAFGETIAEQEEFEDLLRFYWNVTADGAPRLIQHLTGEFNKFLVPFRFKCGRTEGMYSRRDAAVLYIHRRYYPIAIRLVERVQAAIARDLRDSVPLFTRRLARGVGFAEDPGESFGQNRCRILAEAMMTSRDVAEVRRQFEARGLSLDAPWTSTFEPPDGLPSCTSAPQMPAVRLAGHSNYLDIAGRLGARLCRDALWCGGMCNWTAERGGGGEQVYAALGPLHYTGTAGIALFLWRLCQATGEEIFRSTAEGALRQALSKLPMKGCGYYAGPVGILAVASEITGRIDYDGFLRASPDAANLDVMTGSAGAIGPLLRYGLVDLAAQHGEMILAQAHREDRGWWWKTIDDLEGLTGFAHGAGGIGWALAELFAATGECRFRNGALEAFRFEKSCFDSLARTWIDMGDDQQWEAVWCHGGAGIALSRLRAWQILGDDTLRDEARMALGVVRDGLRLVENFSLCHGLAGNADILLEAGEVLGDHEWTAVAKAIADRGIEQYERQRRPWPCGLRNGRETPDLMWGIAGVGDFYLRMAECGVRSVLLPETIRFPG